MPRRLRLPVDSNRPGTFRQGQDARRGTRTGELPESVASALDAKFPGANAEIRHLLRDLVRRHSGVSATAKLCARLAGIWQQVAVLALTDGDVQGAARASRECETFLRRVDVELERAPHRKSQASACSFDKEDHSTGQADSDDVATQEARALLASAQATYSPNTRTDSEAAE